ncbi:MAG: hypothetical protein KDD60_03985 [Bdellovibrionales bacterium]|nr:hypothetical protein [Bdellovibrionales bacterium]
MKKKKKAGELGANLMEYALLATLIAVVSMIAIKVIGESVSVKISSVASGILIE